MMTETDAVAVEDQLMGFLEGPSFEAEANFLKSAVESRSFLCDGCNEQSSGQVFLIEATEDSDEYMLCSECHARGAPPEGSENRPWNQSSEIRRIDIRYPHVTHGAHLIEVRQHHQAAHEFVSANLTDELFSWGCDPEQGDHPTQFLQQGMSRFRMGRIVVKSMAQRRIGFVAEICGCAAKIPWGLVTEKMGVELEHRVSQKLTAPRFQSKVDEILASDGSFEMKMHQVEVAMADEESLACKEFGLATGYDGIVQKKCIMYFLQECKGPQPSNNLEFRAFSAKLDIRKKLQKLQESLSQGTHSKS